MTPKAGFEEEGMDRDVYKTNKQNTEGEII